MDIHEAIQKATQILDEERVRPTTAYEPAPNAGAADLSKSSTGMAALVAIAEMGKVTRLTYERSSRPRDVHEVPGEYKFTSINYELLLALYSQIALLERPQIVPFLLSRIKLQLRAKLPRNSGKYPSFNGEVS